jgi:Na+/H+-dicarboxylate symporter
VTADPVADGRSIRSNRGKWYTSPAAIILLAFVLGVAGGSTWPQLAAALGPVGTIWVKAIGALVVPLVISLLVTSIASLPDTREIGKLGLRTIIVFLALLVTGAAVVAIVTPALLTLLGVTQSSASMLGAAPLATPASRVAPTFWDWIGTLVPTNPIEAAASGALLPLVVFTIGFAVATTRVSPNARTHVVGFFRGVADIMLELVRWVLWTAPIGVFGLALSLGARTGLGSARTILALFMLVAIACLAYVCALYILATVAGGIPFTKFTRAIAPAQIVAFSSRSSLAALPAMIEAGENQLELPPAITGFLLPLAVSTFKLGATIAITTSSLFLARIYGVPLNPSQIASIAISSVLLSFSVPGIPGGVLLIMIPVLTAAGIPAEGIGILLAVDVIPDMFRTLTNVTADMVAAVLVTHRN